MQELCWKLPRLSRLQTSMILTKTRTNILTKILSTITNKNLSKVSTKIPTKTFSQDSCHGSY